MVWQWQAVAGSGRQWQHSEHTLAQSKNCTDITADERRRLGSGHFCYATYSPYFCLLPTSDTDSNQSHSSDSIIAPPSSQQNPTGYMVPRNAGQLGEYWEAPQHTQQSLLQKAPLLQCVLCPGCPRGPLFAVLSSALCAALQSRILVIDDAVSLLASYIQTKSIMRRLRTSVLRLDHSACSSNCEF